MTAPDTAISDDDLMDTLKSLLQERSQLLAKVKDLEVEVAQVAVNVDTLQQAGQSLRAALQESLVSGGGGGGSSRDYGGGGNGGVVVIVIMVVVMVVVGIIVMMMVS